MAGGVTLPDREIVAERVLDAPRDLVFAVWTDPAHLDDWWGPLGFTTTTHDADIRTGGRWRFTMHGPDGTDYGNLVEYLAVEKPARIAYRHAGAEETADVRFEVEVLFADEDGRTRLTMRMRFASDAARDELIARVGALEGVKGTMARLRDHVTTLRGFTVTRVFDAPRELVWRAHTEARHLARWWGPKGFETTVARLELLPGGMFLYRMRSAAGQAMWGRFVFRDIAAPRRLAYVLSFSDEDGGITRAPFGADWPLEVLSIVTLDERDGKTALTLRSWPLDATEAERQAFTGGYKSMDGGFNATYDQLVDYLPGMGG
jgi:uncharacterized protein YndB with AHSA1/START domain